MRAGLLLVVSACCAATLGLAVACSSFGTTSEVKDAAGESGPDAEAGPASCVPPPPYEAPRVCTGDCTATPLFATTLAADQAVVSGTTIYITSARTVRVNPDVNAGVFTQLDQGPALEGTPTKMTVDDTYVYVSTTAQHVRVRRAGGGIEKLDLFAGDVSPVFFGTNVVYQLQPTHVIRTPKGDVDAGVSKTVAGTSALAVDGDDAFWIGPNSASELVILGPFPNLTERASVKAPVLGFVVEDGFAYVAEPSATVSGSSISRIDLGSGARAPLVTEPGKIEALYIERGRLYWVALRLPADGSRAFASVDRCGGPATLLATDLPPLSPLSFDEGYAYATGKSAGRVYRMRK